MKNFTISTLFVFLTLFIGVDFTIGQRMSAEDVLAKHLDSIGTATVRATTKNQVIVGDAVVKFITQKSPQVVGRIVLASSGEKNFLGMSLNSINYPQERFSYDGKNTGIGFVKVGSRSVLGNFILSNEKLLSESLLGGVLNSSWALRDIPNKKAKLSFDGAKKIDGKEVYVLSYLAKSSDITINLYFDKTTFNHVRTEYKRISSAGIGLRPEKSSGFSETRLRIIEDFSDFKAENGMMMPHGYHILYTTTGGSSGTTEIDWSFNLREFAFNQKLADNTFDLNTN